MLCSVAAALSRRRCCAVAAPRILAAAAAAPPRSEAPPRLASMAPAALFGGRASIAARLSFSTMPRWAPTPASPPLPGVGAAVLRLPPAATTTSGLLPLSPPLPIPTPGAVRGMKTNRSVAKRIRVMGSGALKRSRAGRRHNTGYLTRKRKNNLARGTGIKGKKIEKRMRILLNAR